MEMVATRRFYRSRQNKVLAGVSAGLGQYFDVDPVLFRVGFVVLGLASGPVAVAAYVLLALIIPERPLGDVEPPVSSSVALGDGRGVVGVILVGIGLLVLAANIGLFSLVRWDIVWPLVLVAAGAALVVTRFR